MQEGNQQDRQEDFWTGGCKANSRVFHQSVENECQDIAEDSAPTQTERTFSGLRASTVGAQAPPRQSLPINKCNADTPIHYLG
jgi:hypothetical protein